MSILIKRRNGRLTKAGAGVDTMYKQQQKKLNAHRHDERFQRLSCKMPPKTLIVQPLPPYRPAGNNLLGIGSFLGYKESTIGLTVTHDGL